MEHSFHFSVFGVQSTEFQLQHSVASLSFLTEIAEGRGSQESTQDWKLSWSCTPGSEALKAPGVLAWKAHFHDIHGISMLSMALQTCEQCDSYCLGNQMCPKPDRDRKISKAAAILLIQFLELQCQCNMPPWQQCTGRV